MVEVLPELTFFSTVPSAFIFPTSVLLSLFYLSTSLCVCHADYENYCSAEDGTCRQTDGAPEAKVIELEFGVKQARSDDDIFQVGVQEATRLIKTTQEYMQDLVIPHEVRKMCENKHEMCTVWAVAGECQANPGCKF